MTIEMCLLYLYFGSHLFRTNRRGVDWTSEILVALLLIFLVVKFPNTLSSHLFQKEDSFFYFSNVIVIIALILFIFLSKKEGSQVFNIPPKRKQWLFLYIVPLGLTLLIIYFFLIRTIFLRNISLYINIIGIFFFLFITANYQNQIQNTSTKRFLFFSIFLSFTTITIIGLKSLTLAFFLPGKQNVPMHRMTVVPQENISIKHLK